jgi:hypothetical protein
MYTLLAIAVLVLSFFVTAQLPPWAVDYLQVGVLLASIGVFAALAYFFSRQCFRSRIVYLIVQPAVFLRIFPMLILLCFLAWRA